MSKKKPFDDNFLREAVSNHLAQKKKSGPGSSTSSATGGGSEPLEGLNSLIANPGASDQFEFDRTTQPEAPEVNLSLGNPTQSPLGYRGTGLSATIDEQLNSEGEYQSPIDKAQSARLRELSDIYDSVAGRKTSEALIKAPLKDEKVAASTGEESSDFLDRLKTAAKAGTYQLGALAGSIPAAIVDAAGKNDPFKNSGLGILNDWITQLKINDKDGKASTFLKTMVNAPFDLQNKLEETTATNMDAEQLGKLADESLNIPEEYNPLSPNNIVVKEFSDRAAKNSALARAGYEGGISKALSDGNYNTAGRLAAIGVVESLPIMIGLLASRGAGASSTGALGALGLGTTGKEYRDLKASNPDIDKNLLYTNAVLTGASEAGSELLGTNMIYDQARGLFNRGLRDEAEQVVRSGIRGYIDNAFKKAFIGAAAFDEGSTEAVNQIVKNAVDKWSGVRPDVDYTDGALDAFIIGVGAGGVVAAPIHAASKVANIQNKSRIRSLVDLNNSMDPFLASDDISPAAREKMMDQVASNNEIINDIIEQDAQQTSAILNPQEKTQVDAINTLIDSKESIINDPEIPEPVKEAARNSVTELEQQSDEILQQAQARADQFTKIEQDLQLADTPEKIQKIVADIQTIDPEANNEAYQGLIQQAETKLAEVKAAQPKEGESTTTDTKDNLFNELEQDLEEMKTPIPEEAIVPAAEEVISETPVVASDLEVPIPETVVAPEAVAPVTEDVVTPEPAAVPRTMEDIQADKQRMITRYQEVLRERGLYDQAAQGALPAEQVEAIRQEIEQEFGVTREQLLAEEAALNTAPVEEAAAPVIEEPAAVEEPAAPAEEVPPVEKPKKPKKEKAPSLTEEEVTRKKELSAKFRSSLNDISRIPTLLADKEFREWAGLVLKEAKGDFVSFAKEIVDNVGEQIRSHLPKFYKEIGGTDPVGEMDVDEQIEPEVIEEIEKAPEEITAEELEAFKKRLNRLLNNAKTKTLIKSGVVKATLATDALKKVTEITDHKSMLAAGRAVKKVFKDIIKNAFTSQIREAKAGLKVRLKGSKLAKTDLIRKFMNINERTLELEDLEKYNTLVRTLNDQYNARMEGVVADTDIQAFVDYIADKQAKQIFDEQVNEAPTEEAVEEEAKPKESARRKQLEAAVEVNRQTLRKGGYNPAFKEVATALLNVDTSELSNRQMVDLNMALINLAVNDRLVNHGGIFRKYIGEKRFAELKTKVGDSIKGLLESTLGAAARSLDVNTKIIFKGIKDAATFQNETGVAGISNANSQVTNIDMKGLEKSYKDLVKSLNFDDFNSTENRFLRALYSNATQFSSVAKEGKDFTRYKSLIKQSAEKLTKSNIPSEQREGQLRMDQYNEYLAPFETRTEFENNFKQQQPKNVKVVDFFRNAFNNKLPEMKTNSLIYGSKNIKEVNNYLPMSWKQYSGTETETPEELSDIVEPIYDFDPETGDISERQASSVIERTSKSKIKDTDRILNMDFDKYIFDKYRELNYDIRTLKFRHLYNAIKSQEGFADVVGGAANSKILTNGVRNMVKRQMGQGFINSEVKPLVDASRVLSAKGVRQALFGVSQILKQYPSVAVRTMVNLNSDIGLFLKGIGVGMNNPIFDNFGVGLRGSTKGGTNYELELNNIRKSDFSSTPGKLVAAVNRASKNIADMLATPLAHSDDAVAKHSWIAYYLQYIKQNGGDISKIDWQTEHLNPNNEAGAYADLMVSTTQNINDNSKQGSLLYDDGTAKTIVRDVLAPFSSFARNSQANLEADLRTFSGGTTAEKKAAAWGIISNVSEQIAFNTIKAVVIASMIKAGSSFVQSLFGEEPEEKEPMEGTATRVLKNSAADILFSGLGQAASYLAIKGVNQANKAVQGTDKDFFYQYDPKKYGEPDFGIAGIYGIFPQAVYNAMQKADYVDGVLSDTYTKKDGTEVKATVNLKPEDQALVSMLFFADALALAGLSDAEISRLNQTIFRDVKKRTQPVKSFKIEYVNKKANARKEEVKKKD